MTLISPMMRKSSSENVIDLNMQPCGGYPKGNVHFATTPGSRNFIAWNVKHPAPNGTCIVRLGMGADEADFKVLLPLDRSGVNGSFPCGREETNLEGKEFKFPRNFTCDACTLQLEWTIGYDSKNHPIQQHRCAEVQVIEKEVEECVGKCKNGGVCMNGECKCRKGYSGSYCQTLDSDSSALGTVLFYFALFLVIIALIVALFYGSFRIIKYIVRQHLLSRLLNRKSKGEGCVRLKKREDSGVMMTMGRLLIRSQENQASLLSTTLVLTGALKTSESFVYNDHAQSYLEVPTDVECIKYHGKTAAVPK